VDFSTTNSNRIIELRKVPTDLGPNDASWTIAELAAKNLSLVGLGSYIVNSGGCNECHTHPSYLPAVIPTWDNRKVVNSAQFVSGGRTFGP
jgi:hypothetical protein